MSEKELETVKVIPGDYIIIEWNSDGGNGHYDNEFEVIQIAEIKDDILYSDTGVWIDINDFDFFEVNQNLENKIDLKNRLLIWKSKNKEKINES
jgi:hypothetical protein